MYSKYYISVNYSSSSECEVCAYLQNDRIATGSAFMNVFSFDNISMKVSAYFWASSSWKKEAVLKNINNIGRQKEKL